MECGNCGSDSKVLKTKRVYLHQIDGSVRQVIQRRRECLQCRSRFTTRETPQGECTEPANTA